MQLNYITSVTRPREITRVIYLGFLYKSGKVEVLKVH